MRVSRNGRAFALQAVDGLFLVLVALLVLLPILGQLLFGAQPQSDNRRLADPPRFPASWADLVNWPRGIDAYLNDHFGLRRHFVNLDGYLRWRYLGSGPSTAVVVGRNGRLFSSEGDVPFRVLLSNCGAWWNDEQVGGFTRDIAPAIDRMRQLAPDMSILVIPTASVLYPQDLPAWISDSCRGRTPLVDQIRQRLSIEARSLVSYPLDVAEALAIRSPMYPKVNFHWDGDGVSTFMSHIAEQDWLAPRLASPAWTEVEKTSDLSVYLPGVELRYHTLAPQWRRADVEVCAGDACAATFPLVGVKLPSETMRLHRQGAGPKLLILNDSFGAGAANALFAYFDDIIIINMNNFPRLSLEERRSLWERLTQQWRPDRILMLMQDGNFTGIPRFVDGFAKL